MNKIQERINNVELEIKHNLRYDLSQEFDVICLFLDKEHQLLFENDIERFNEVGRFVIQNTFCGGILFLKKPEFIKEIVIKINYEYEVFEASVEYKSKIREKENIKYKPNASNIEIEVWHAKKIFPNFFKYNDNIQLGLLTIIGKLVKKLCEYGKDNLAHMNFINNFLIKLVKDGDLKQELNLNVNLVV